MQLCAALRSGFSQFLNCEFPPSIRPIPRIDFESKHDAPSVMAMLNVRSKNPTDRTTVCHKVAAHRRRFQ
ncbi:MAG: hypothetical protein DMF04_00845 [Verrucomicrobia bacterium]|nr:MAG: hypothetical protein DMF04_00845 [Verrucomicrobiota bacterium]